MVGSRYVVVLLVLLDPSFDVSIVSFKCTRRGLPDKGSDHVVLLLFSAVNLCTLLLLLGR